MNRASLLIAMIAAGSIAGCADISRSRDLHNPKVPAVATAQQVCSNCHGVTGNSISPNFPNLAAQTAPYLVAQLKEFRSHDRQDPAGFEYMWGLSRSLTDEQIDGLAAYYSSQHPQHQQPEGDPQRAAAGKLIFSSGVPGKNVPACLVCHGESGQGNANFPRLAGQHLDYVIKQLIVFQRTDQRPEGSIMKTIAHELSMDDIQNVAAFVQGLGSP